MKFTPAKIPDIFIIEPQVFGDERGFFMETFQADEFRNVGLPYDFVQDNHSGSRQGILRGLHYQVRYAQGKLVRVVFGEIFDVAVDIRRSSPTLGKWFGTSISASNRYQLWIPQGFAHGFYVLSEWAEIVYKTTDFYAPDWERTLAWDDPEVAVDWPLINGEVPALSQKDSEGLPFHQVELYP